MSRNVFSPVNTTPATFSLPALKKAAERETYVTVSIMNEKKWYDLWSDMRKKNTIGDMIRDTSYHVIFMIYHTTYHVICDMICGSGAWNHLGLTVSFVRCHRFESYNVPITSHSWYFISYNVICDMICGLRALSQLDLIILHDIHDVSYHITWYHLDMVYQQMRLLIYTRYQDSWCRYRPLQDTHTWPPPAVAVKRIYSNPKVAPAYIAAQQPMKVPALAILYTRRVRFSPRFFFVKFVFSAAVVPIQIER